MKLLWSEYNSYQALLKALKEKDPVQLLPHNDFFANTNNTNNNTTTNHTQKTMNNTNNTTITSPHYNARRVAQLHVLKEEIDRSIAQYEHVINTKKLRIREQEAEVQMR